MRLPHLVRHPQGFTLLELLVVLTVLGVVLGVSGLAIVSLQAPRESEEILALNRARADAIHSGAPRSAHGVRFLPDGRAIGLGVNALTGDPLAK
jgi:prepilin-type N-terminal cleavage/methylation domain-containing protein